MLANCSVVNQGNQYEPPKMCANKKISTQIPHMIAALGLDFYLDKIAQIEKLIAI